MSVANRPRVLGHVYAQRRKLRYKRHLALVLPEPVQKLLTHISNLNKGNAVFLTWQQWDAVFGPYTRRRSKVWRQFKSELRAGSVVLRRDINCGNFLLIKV